MWASSNGTSWGLMGDGASAPLNAARSNQAIIGDGKWRHIIWQRRGVSWQLYIDGILDCAYDSATAITTDPGAGVYLMAHGNEAYALGGDFLDGIRFSKTVEFAF